MATFKGMLTPALLLHASMFFLTQATGLILSPLDTLPLDREAWEDLPPGSLVIQKTRRLNGTGEALDSTLFQIRVQPGKTYDVEWTGFESSIRRDRLWGISRRHPGDSADSYKKTDSTDWEFRWSYRKQTGPEWNRWISTTASDKDIRVKFDSLEETSNKSNPLQVRREVEKDDYIRTDSVWTLPDGRPSRGSETTRSTVPNRFPSISRVEHSWSWSDGRILADTIRTRGIEGQVNGDTTWTDTLRYSWEQGRLVKYTGSVDSAWMEWSPTGTPVHYLYRSWSPRLPSANTARYLNTEETWWDAQGRQISSHSSYNFSMDIDSLEYQGSSAFPSRNLRISCTYSMPGNAEPSEPDCRTDHIELIETTVSNVSLHEPARGSPRSTVRIAGHEVLFQNLSVVNGQLEHLTLDGKLLAKIPVVDGQAMLATPRRGVTLWRVRSPTGAVSEASRLILP
ncbi:MAG: hypothetical protein IPO40_19500 [Fibrobacteres bacterium]|nr:hypothetical protein [Fibrobacterota bacterium]